MEAFASEIEEIAQSCKQAWQRGLLAGFNGNASCRVSLDVKDFRENPNVPVSSEGCLITCSGVAKSMLLPSHFALLTLPEGQHIAGPAASSEAAMHLAIYRQCPQSRAILHCHPPHLLALSLRLPPENRLQLPLFEAETYRAQLGFTPSHAPGTAALAAVVAEKAVSFSAIWMEQHGLTVHAATIAKALGLAEELEQLARIQLLASSHV